VLHGAGVAAAGFTAQLASGRGGASGGAVAVLLGGLLVRMVGDGVDTLGWIRWLSPFGLVALVEPFGASPLFPLVVLGVAGLALSG